jgi:parallel beta-helix repeat protein
MGISVLNFGEVVIKENTINQCHIGMYLYGVSSAYISSNNITGSQTPDYYYASGVTMQNCGGYLRNNIIKYNQFAVFLIYSSPVMGVNTLEQNYKCGLYISDGSYPNLVQQLTNPTCWYPIGGCNIIKNNGTYTSSIPSTHEIQSDGAEIFLNSGDAILSYGYNEISDDRTGIPDYLTSPLIKGTRSRLSSRQFFVDRNYWGEVGPSPSRFGTLNAVYEPVGYYCPLPDMPCSGGELIIQTTDGIVIDTIGSRERDSGDLAALEENYAIADKLFYSGDIDGAKIIYEQIVAGPYTSEEKLFAYKKLYEIGEILRADHSYFAALQNTYNNILSSETDTLLIKIYNQNSILCDVSRQEYLTAISRFDNIIQQNPNSEEAIYAEIDIITTALNLDTTNSQLGKMGGGKYLVKGTSDYLTRLNNLLQNKFGINSEEKEQIIPKEYSLYQNYPNPFNPTTTIKFDIPKDGLITLEIFDILGRRIAALINENRSAGSYEQVFNASSLASGVYVYKLQAGDFVSSKKMILLK